MQSMSARVTIQKLPIKSNSEVQKESQITPSTFMSLSFMDGCVKRHSKIELEKLRFIAELEAERLRNIPNLKSHILKFDIFWKEQLQ